MSCSAGERQVYDIMLALSFFSIVLSPLAISAVLDLMDHLAERRQAAPANNEAPRHA